MDNTCKTCPNERVHTLQFQRLREDLGELKGRVGHLESTLSRGVALLIANLVGVIVTLGHALLR